MCRVTVLLPCRDAAAHLEAAIASIREQSFTDYEVVAVDDGSTDRTPDLLDGWAREDDRVRIIRGERRGLVPALTAGLEVAEGELIARMDADDIAAPDRLERQVALLDSRPDLAACGAGVEYFPPDQVGSGARRYEAWINRLVTPHDIARAIFVECPIPHPTLVIRREGLLEVGGYRDLDWPEDYDLVLRLWAAGRRMAKVPEPHTGRARVLLRWRERPDRASRTDERYSPEAFRRLKIAVLRETLLRGDRTVVIAGAGPIGKRWAVELQDAGTPLTGFLDVDPRKIGQWIHGARVRGYPALSSIMEASDPAPLVLAAVGQVGARAEIRRTLRQAGLVELRDFVAVA